MFTPTYTFGVQPSLTVPGGALDQNFKDVGTQFGLWLGNASLPVAVPNSPTGNPTIATNSVLSIAATSNSSAAREFAAQIGITIVTGSSEPSPGLGDKVALYAGAVANTGGGNAWAFNPLITVNSGWTGCGTSPTQNAQCAEFDVNNFNIDYGPSSGTTFGNPSVVGIIITGASTKFCTAALQITGNIGAGAMWRYGIWFGNLSIQNATIADTTNSITSYVVNGQHTYGIDFNTGVYTGAPIRLGNNQIVTFRNPGGTADLNLIGSAGSNISIGGTGVGGIFVANGVYPSATNSIALGQSSNVYSVIWAQQAVLTTGAPNNGAGTITLGGTTASTVGAAGAASALPANPLGYMIINVAGTQAKIPYYNN